MTKKFDNQEAPYNLRFSEKVNILNKLNLTKRQSKFIDLVVNF